MNQSPDAKSIEAGKGKTPMDANQAMILQMQQQMHEANQNRLDRIEKLLEKKDDVQTKHGEMLIKISRDVESMGGIATRIDHLEKADEQHKGALAVIGAISTLAGGAVEFFFHKFFLK